MRAFPLVADAVEKVESSAAAKTSLILTRSEHRQEKPSHARDNGLFNPKRNPGLVIAPTSAS
jgi:hypothetical protein